MKIDELGVESWMSSFGGSVAFDLAETCVSPLTLGELLALAGEKELAWDALQHIRLDYGAARGSMRLRSSIAALYEDLVADNILLTHGAIGANALIYATLLEAGDRVISFTPSFQQLYSMPASIGADVVRLNLRADRNFRPDIDELHRLATPGTKLFSIANPNNPTGVLLDRDMLEEIADVARRCGAWILCDEVYRGIDQSGSGSTSSMIDIYEKAISTGSLSKAYSLAGLRLGWIAAPTDLIGSIARHRDYNTISVGVIDDYCASIALEHGEMILERNRSITRRNLRILADFVDAEPLLSWTEPQGGTAALVRYHLPIPSVEFCRRLLDEEDVLLVPGSVFEMEGHVRIGFASRTDILRQGLSRISAFLNRLAGTVSA